MRPPPERSEQAKAAAPGSLIIFERVGAVGILTAGKQSGDVAGAPHPVWSQPPRPTHRVRLRSQGHRCEACHAACFTDVGSARY